MAATAVAAAAAAAENGLLPTGTSPFVPASPPPSPQAPTPAPTSGPALRRQPYTHRRSPRQRGREGGPKTDSFRSAAAAHRGRRVGPAPHHKSRGVRGGRRHAAGARGDRSQRGAGGGGGCGGGSSGRQAPTGRCWRRTPPQGRPRRRVGGVSGTPARKGDGERVGASAQREGAAAAASTHTRL